MDQKTQEEKKLYDQIFDLLSYEKIIFSGKNNQFSYFVWILFKFIWFFCITDLQMKPYRTDEFVHKLFYETSRFSAFNNQWVVKAHINNCQRDPTQSSERDITYQVPIKYIFLLTFLFLSAIRIQYSMYQNIIFLC